MDYEKIKQFNNRDGITFIEIMMAFLILGAVFLPIFTFLTDSVKETEKFYTETVAISRAKFVMDSVMFQLPWRSLREGSPCRFEDPKRVEGIEKFMAKAIPRMMGSFKNQQLWKTPDKHVFLGDGIYKDRKGFMYRTRVKVVDLDYDSTSNPIKFKIDLPYTTDSNKEVFSINKLVPKDADGKFNLIKKVIVQVKWSNIKGLDPEKDSRAKNLFLVGFKSNLEG